MEFKARKHKKELSPKEAEVIEYVMKGYTDKEIGNELEISPRTVTTHITKILTKLEAINRVEAAVKYKMSEQGNCQKPIGV